ncbi:MAG: DsbA family protein [Armatimonadota bacterium]
MKVNVEYFTDPICAWSYVSEPTIQSLLSDHRENVDFRFRSLPILDKITGQRKEGEKFRTPQEMQQEWTEISLKTGVRLDPSLWQEDPPHSSWPANRAMKAALRQGLDKGNRFIHLLRDAALVDRKNPSDMDILKDIAYEAALDVDQFYVDMTENAQQLEKEVADDAIEANERCIYNTPTLVMQNDEGDGVIITGTIDYQVANHAIRSLLGQKVIGTPESIIAPSM